MTKEKNDEFDIVEVFKSFDEDITIRKEEDKYLIEVLNNAPLITSMETIQLLLAILYKQKMNDKILKEKGQLREFDDFCRSKSNKEIIKKPRLLAELRNFMSAETSDRTKWLILYRLIERLDWS